MTPTLSLCMVFKNEFLYLQDAVLSVWPIVDECILVDSGSTDGTTELVLEWAQKEPKIKYFLNPWPGHFSEQRNFSLSKATSDWILVLDADERILKEDHFKLLTSLKNPEVIAYQLPIRNYTENFTELGFILNEDPPYSYGYVPTFLHRLFRRHLEIHYTGILHERIEPSLQKINAKISPLSVIIHHLGPLKEKKLELQHERLSFYEELALKKVKENPEDAQAHWELGVIFQKQKKFHEAEQAFLKATTLSPLTEEFELYYFMTLFQQQKWGQLKTSFPQHSKSYFFVLLAQAQTDASALESLDSFRNDFIQAHLFIFELSLKHQRKDRILKDRELAKMYFENTGLVEFLEGTHLRHQGRLQESEYLLKEALKKNCVFATKEFLVLLTQQGRYEEAIAFSKTLPKDILDTDAQRVITFATSQSSYQMPINK